MGFSDSGEIEKRREAKKKKKAGDIRPVEIIEIEPVSEIAQENEPEVIEVIEETPVIETITPVEDENEKVQQNFCDCPGFFGYRSYAGF